MSEWNMVLQRDVDNPNFAEGPAYGFVLVQKPGGGFTGWIDISTKLREAVPRRGRRRAVSGTAASRTGAIPTPAPKRYASETEAPMPPVAPPTTTPTDPRPHGASLRGLDRATASSTRTGRFGRMFRQVPIYEHDPRDLIALGDSMVQPPEPVVEGDTEGPKALDKPLGAADDDENTATLDGELRLPAGYTYFGQFVDHDITFDPVSSLTRQNDPDALIDFRTPRFDLDSLYGRGPSDQPYLYERRRRAARAGRAASPTPRDRRPDLQRVTAGRALIGDPRNDENLIVSQLQVAFIRFHNAVVDAGRDDRARLLGCDDLFKLAQQTVRWHYQWVVIHDFLARLVGPCGRRRHPRREAYASGDPRRERAADLVNRACASTTGTRSRSCRSSSRSRPTASGTRWRGRAT